MTPSQLSEQSVPRRTGAGRVVTFPRGHRWRGRNDGAGAAPADVEYRVQVHWLGARGLRRYAHESDDDYAARQHEEGLQRARATDIAVMAPPIDEWQESDLRRVIATVLDELPSDGRSQGLAFSSEVQVGRWPARRNHTLSRRSWLSIQNGLGFSGTLELDTLIPSSAFARWLSELPLAEASFQIRGRVAEAPASLDGAQ